MNLSEAVLKELNRVQELKQEYMKIPMGFIVASMMQEVIVRTQKAMLEGDVVILLRCYNELKDFE